MVLGKYNALTKNSEIFNSVIDLDNLNKTIDDLFPLVLKDEDLSDRGLKETKFPTPQDLELYISRGVIDKRIEALKKEIKRDMGDDYVIVYLADGAIPFNEEFTKGTKMVSYDMKAKSYEDNKSTDNLKILKPINSDDIKGRTVLLLDDIIDTGNTAEKTRDYLISQGAAEVKTCFLLDKISQRVNGFKADYVGIQIPNDYVIGFGMDIEVKGKEYCRGLKHIYKNNPKN